MSGARLNEVWIRFLTITETRTPPMQSRGDENLAADSIGPMLLGHPHGKSEKICAQLRLLR
jgi:hypothetical protein